MGDSSLENSFISDSGSPKKLHECPCCGKIFSQSGDLKRHVKAVHEGVKDQKCETCGKCFAEAGSLKKHIRAIHEGKDKYFSSKLKLFRN